MSDETKKAPDTETTPHGAPTAPADETPSAVSIDVVTALHDRLLKLTAAQQTTDAAVEALLKRHDADTQLVRELREHVADLLETAGAHADLLDGLTRTFDEIRTRVANPAKRGEGERRLPPASADPGAPLAPGQERSTELQIDPSKEGKHTFPLASGGELVVNVKKARGGPVVRDGKPAAGKGAVRRS